MFQEIEVSLLLLPAIVLVAIFTIFAVRRLSREANSQKKLVRRIRFTLLLAGGFFIYLWFLLPSTPSLSTFGYPKTVDDIGSPEKILHYLQWYNRSIVRTTDIVHWAISVAVFFVGGSIEAALREFNAIVDQADTKNEKSI